MCIFMNESNHPLNIAKSRSFPPLSSLPVLSLVGWQQRPYHLLQNLCLVQTRLMDQKAGSGVIGGGGPPAGQSDFRFRSYTVIAQLLTPAAPTVSHPWIIHYFALPGAGQGRYRCLYDSFNRRFVSQNLQFYNYVKPLQQLIEMIDTYIN